MRVLVTGGSGRIGAAVVSELAARGHEVFSADVAASPSPGKEPPSLRVDLTRPGEAYEAVARARAETVVHLAAWASSRVVPYARTYGDNVTGTYNVLQAAADLKVSRVICASSAQVYGFLGLPPVSLPVDENHPLRILNCYALSKQAGELACRYFVETASIQIASFRFLGVRDPETYAREVEMIRARPEAGLRHLWHRCDTRDAAVACRLAVEADHLESGEYNISGPSILPGEEALELLRSLTGPDWPLDGVPTELFSLRKARELLGYQPVLRA